MLVKTRGVVLKCTRYSESSVVLQVFTEELGLQSYLINGIRKSKSKHSPAVMQPLHLLEMVVYNKEGGSIQRVSEIRNAPPFKDIPFNTVKTTLLLFLNEVVYKSIKQGHRDTELFSFIFYSLQSLDLIKGVVSDYHIHFIIRLAGFLGICPSGSIEGFEHDEIVRSTKKPESASGQHVYFDLKNGVFTTTRPVHPAYAEPEASAQFLKILNLVAADSSDLESAGASDYDSLNPTFDSLNKADRKAILILLLEYFAWHVEGFGHIKSMEILEEVFR